MPSLESSTSNAAAYPAIGVIFGGAIALAQVAGISPSSGATAQVLTLTVSAPTAGQVYSYIVTPYGGAAQTISVTATSTTPADLIALFLAAHKANAYAYAAVSIATTSTTMVFTDRAPGANVTSIVESADPTNDLSFATTTAGAAAGTFTIGRYAPATFSTTTPGEISTAQPSALAGPVLTLTIVHDASGAYSADLVYTDPAGATSSVDLSFAQGGSAGGTDDAAEAELAAELGASGTLVTIANPSTGVVTATFPVGYSVDFSNVAATGGSAALTLSVAAGSARPALPALVLASGESSDTIGTARSATRAGSVPSGLIRGNGVRVTVEDPGAAVTVGAPVWIESSTGAPKAAAAPGRYMHPRDVWVIRNVSDPFGNTVAVVEAR